MTSAGTILFVCAGNVCRSPLAQLVVSTALRRSGIDGVEILSAGTEALVGAPMDPQAAELASLLDCDPRYHRGRQLDEKLLKRCEMVLTSTRSQRSEVVEVMPRAVKHTWTIRQFGLVLTESEYRPARSGDIGTLVDFVNHHRGLHYRPDHSSDDVIDPYRRPAAVHQLAAWQMRLGLEQLCRALGAQPLAWRVPEPLEEPAPRPRWWQRLSLARA
jgi:protein-tyrosine phosphatase